MNIIFMIGLVPFTVVGLLWIISSILHRPIIGGQDGLLAKDRQAAKDAPGEQEVAITAATWSILHPPH